MIDGGITLLIILVLGGHIDDFKYLLNASSGVFPNPAVPDCRSSPSSMQNMLPSIDIFNSLGLEHPSQTVGNSALGRKSKSCPQISHCLVIVSISLVNSSDGRYLSPEQRPYGLPAAGRTGVAVPVTSALEALVFAYRLTLAYRLRQMFPCGGDAVPAAALVFQVSGCRSVGYL